MLPSTTKGTEVGAQEWRYYLFLCYGINIPDLLDHYNRCGAALLIFHTLNCKKGSLITSRHNELRDGVSDLAGKVFTPAHVRDEPTIISGRAVHGGEAKSKEKGKGPSSQDKGEEKGDTLIRNLWMQETYSIQDMNFVNTDAVSYQYKIPRSAWILLRGRRRRSNYTIVSTSVSTSLPSLNQWKDLSGLSQR